MVLKIFPVAHDQVLDLKGIEHGSELLGDIGLDLGHGGFLLARLLVQGDDDDVVLLQRIRRDVGAPDVIAANLVHQDCDPVALLLRGAIGQYRMRNSCDQ